METNDRVFVTDNVAYDAVGPTMRTGEIAEAVIEAVAHDNPEQDVYVTDRGDYLHIHTLMECRLTRDSLQRSLGRNYELPMLEMEMASFSGRMQTSDNEYRWYFKS
jgi:hypothetical protein